ncbi:DUF4141 domain-containing protein [Proteiniphilum sp. UBA5346]|uniref:DUF4141 domain-containing protein n=1 Tax=Proteiniphilum sp. UBA5346 TaxID=1947277 RepID=UPI00257E8254|nr:DUF4141 domain-containing protein [Proteiniphilum sp. UBA5346]
MKKKILIMALLVTSLSANAQFIVNDPINVATSIANTAKEIIQTSKTVSNTLNSFKEVEKVYNQGKQYYDALRKVNNLVRDARKVQQTILALGDISDIYVNNYKLMLQDKNFSLEELNAIAYGYTQLLEESAGLLNELKLVVNPSTLSLNDKERLDLIDRIYIEVIEYRSLVSYYTNKNISVSYLRAKKENETQRVIDLYGSAPDKYW